MGKIYGKYSGVWRDINVVYAKSSGVWRPIKNVYANDAGTWRLVYGGNTGTSSFDGLVTFTGSISGTTLSVSSISSGVIEKGMIVEAANGTTQIIPNNRDGRWVANYPRITAQLSGTTGGTGTYTLSNSYSIGSSTLYAKTPTAKFTGSISGTTLTATFSDSADRNGSLGSLKIGSIITGTGVSSDTYIVGFGTGDSGSGTYTLNTSQTVSSTTMYSTQTYGTFTVPQGVYSVTIQACGGGGGGGFTFVNNNNSNAAGGGGGGTNIISTTASVLPGSEFVYKVGGGGARANYTNATTRPSLHGEPGGISQVIGLGNNSGTTLTTGSAGGGGSASQNATPPGASQGGAGVNGANAGGAGAGGGGEHGNGGTSNNGGRIGGDGGDGWVDVNPPNNNPQNPFTGQSGFVKFIY